MRFRLISLLTLVTLTAPVVVAQQRTLPSAQTDPSDAPDPGAEARARILSDMAKKAAKDRVAALRNDTDKLLRLSTELKTYVDKSDENVLSLDVIKKAEEIEKLAKSVRDKMKGPN